ncbi:MAG: tetratricopeptide repeat protein [Candidatus Sumerlaeaceae bacterium]|nr:tetratricopeptide repeat protein [Candidatus Sumerlaeaceae bacterium]
MMPMVDIKERSPRILKGALFLTSVLYAFIPVLWGAIARENVTPMRVSDLAAQQKRNTSAIATILGEFRTNLSDMLFIKTERYLHGGVAYMPHIDTEQLASSGDVMHSKHELRRPATSDAETSVTELPNTDLPTTGPGDQGTPAGKEDELHREEEAATLIRTPENDFRGFLGTLERTVKPWRDPRLPHEHIGGVELLPWYRLATLVDPKNVRAYMIGAWWLKTIHDEHALREAVKFLEEGIRQNPQSFQLHLMLGYILRDLGEKQRALSAFEKAVTLVAKQRPPTGDVGPNWTIYNEEDAIAACSMAVLQRRELHEDDVRGLEDALHRLRELRAQFRNMPVLERLERSLSSQLEAARKTKS